MNARRSELRAAVKKRLVPHFETLGFESTRKKATKAHWAELNRWGYGYARRRGACIDFLEVYWDKYGRPWFYIDFATCQTAEIAGNSLPDSWRSGLLRSGSDWLGFGGQWYGKSQRPEVAVDLAIERMAELELYFTSGRVTAHTSISEESGGAIVVRELAIWERIILPPLGVLMILTIPFRILWWLLEDLREKLERRGRSKSSGSVRR
jgi:hypothetical protein